jgi:hypothetical protein
MIIQVPSDDYCHLSDTERNCLLCKETAHKAGQLIINVNIIVKNEGKLHHKIGHEGPGWE